MPVLFTGEWNLFWECHGILRGPRSWTELGATCLFTLQMARACFCACVWRGPRTAAYALCIINEHAERNHNERSTQHNASVSKARVRGHVWLCVRLPRTETNNKTFESAGGFMYVTRKQKKAVGCITGDRGQTVCVVFHFYVQRRLKLHSPVYETPLLIFIGACSVKQCKAHIVIY